MKLLTTGNPKTAKSTAYGYLTAILHLAPHKSAGGPSVCPNATPGCIAACLNTAGRGGIFKRGESSNAIQRARIARTQLWQSDPDTFLAQLTKELRALERRASKLGLKPAVRLNGTSDLPWEDLAPELFVEFPGIQFYDYTKEPMRVVRSHFGLCAHPSNYRLTYSLHDRPESLRIALELLRGGANVAAVAAGFDLLERCMVVGESFSMPGAGMMLDGDSHDLRFLDPPGSIVVLSPKGRAKQDRTGFVLRRK